LKEVTTSSIEAYRYYAEGISLHERGREPQAVEPLEKAAQIDPNFALALMKLAVVHNNLGHSNLRRQYAERALQHVDRLTPRERYYVEGFFYSDRTETLAKAIEAYKKAVELYPDAASSRNNLAVIYNDLERYDEAIRELEELRRRSFEFPGTYGALAGAYVATGAFDKAQLVLEQFLREHPDAGGAYSDLGDVLVAAGQLDQAAAAYERAVQLVPANPFPRLGLHDVAVLREDWTAADANGRKLASASDAFSRFLGNEILGIDAVLRGRLAEGLRLLEASVITQGPGGSAQSAFSRNAAAQIQMAMDQNAHALDQAERALKDAAGRRPEWDSLALIVEGHARLGHREEAARALELLTTRANALPSEREKRRVLLVNGVLALARGDTDTAVRALTQAEPKLPASTDNGPFRPHVPIWFAAGEAHLAAHHDAEAAARFQKIVTAGPLRLGFPIEFGRSLYLLGQISERGGDRAKAADYYRRFVRYWAEGDIDRERVADARKKLAGS